MGKLEEIIIAVAELTSEEMAKFRRWFDEFDGELFDQRIERDAKAGKLDRLSQEAVEFHRNGTAGEL